MKQLLLVMIMAGACVAFASPVMSASSAVAEQGQYQGQGQSQSFAPNLENVGNSSSSLSFSQKFDAAQPLRGLPLPSAVAVETRGGPAMFSRPEQDKGPNFISVIDLIGLLNNAVIGEMDYDEGAMKIGVQMLNEPEPEVLEGESMEKPLHFSLVGKGGVYKQGFKPIAILNLEADEEVNSAVLAAGLSHKAKELGCSEITFIREGVVRELNSTGYGIGLSYNYATVASGANGFGGVGAGGTGWSHGTAQYFSFPYLTAVCGK